MNSRSWMSPYEVLGGAGWFALPEGLRRLHSPGRASGELDVELGTHWIARCLAWCLRFPLSGPRTAVKLLVDRDGPYLVWRRWFGPTLVLTDQHARDGALVERFGMMELTFQLVITDRSIEFLQRRAAILLGPLRVPLPSRVAPRAHGLVRAVAEGAAVSITVRLPWVGLLLSYHGLMRPERGLP